MAVTVGLSDEDVEGQGRQRPLPKSRQDSDEGPDCAHLPSSVPKRHSPSNPAWLGWLKITSGVQSEAHFYIRLGSFNKGHIYWEFMELKGRPCRTPFNGNYYVGLGSPGPHGPLSPLHCVSVGFSVYSGGTRWPCASEVTPSQLS